MPKIDLDQGYLRTPIICQDLECKREHAWTAMLDDTLPGKPEMRMAYCHYMEDAWPIVRIGQI